MGGEPPTCTYSSATCDTQTNLATDRSLENIDFGSSAAYVCTIRVNWSRVRFARTCAARKTLSGEVGQDIAVTGITIFCGSDGKSVQSLVSNSANIARVVGVWPLNDSNQKTVNLYEFRNIPCPRDWHRTQLGPDFPSSRWQARDQGCYWHRAKQQTSRPSHP